MKHDKAIENIESHSGLLIEMILTSRGVYVLRGCNSIKETSACNFNV